MPTFFGTEGDDPHLVGSGGPDTIYGLGGNDNIDGVFGADIIYGGEGNDYIRGDTGAFQTFFGGAGDDNLAADHGGSLLQPGAGNDSVQGGSGFDTVDYTDALSGIHLKLDGFDMIDIKPQTTGGSGFDTVVFMDAALGSDFNDDLSGGSRVDGRGGDDVLQSKEMIGGAGHDIFRFVAGLGQVVIDDFSTTDDRLEIDGAQAWTSISESGADTVITFAGGDSLRVRNIATAALTGTGVIWRDVVPTSLNTVTGTAGDDNLTGTSGDDHLAGLGGVNMLYGGRGSDFYERGVNAVADYARFDYETRGVSVDLSLTGWQEIGTGLKKFADIHGLVGSPFDDILTGSASGDDLYAGAGGFDKLYGGGGGDRLYGGGGDYLDGGDGADEITGHGGDILVGGAGDDHLLATVGETSPLMNNQTGGYLSGGGGNDLLEFAPGVGGFADGEAGVDTLLVWAAAGVSHFLVDTAHGGVFADGERLIFTPTGAVEAIRATGGDGDDTLYGADGGANTLIGGGGADQIFGGAMADTLSGGDGDDVIQAGASDNVTGGAGNDTLFGGAAHLNTVFFSGAREGYTVVKDGSGGYVVTDIDTTNGDDGQDHISGFQYLSFNGPSINLLAQPAPYDFNGDNRSDVLWRNDSGELFVWNSVGSNSVVYAGQSLSVTGPEWHVQGAADYNGDGKADVLWRDDAGDVYVYASDPGDGASFTGQSISTVDNAWHIQGAEVDFTDDGRADVLWRNTDGEVYVWASNTGTDISFTGQSLGFVDNDWQIKALADFNGDGRGDVLWRDSAGDVYVWKASGAGPLTMQGQSISTVGTDWDIQGVGDFNGDGRSDVLWRNTDGELWLWYSNTGADVSFQGRSLGLVDLSWSVASVGDYDGDGRADILWRNTDGRTYLWENYDKGDNFAMGAYDYGVIPGSWHVLSDFHGI